MTRRAVLLWGVQGLLAAVVVGFLARTLGRHWDEFRALELPLHLDASWLGLSAAIVLLTYAVLVAAWSIVIAGWGERLAYRRAVGIWTLSNLGRYVPGKIWSIAGLALLAQREGVSGWAAVGAAVAMQAIAMGSGVAVVAASAPGALSPWGLTAAAAVAAVTIVSLVSPVAVALIARLTGRESFRPLPAGTVAAAGAAMTVGWVGYGLAFWALARGMLGPTGLEVGTATGVFAAGYLIGLLALFAPGGVGVREAVFVALLAPAVGSGGAIVLSVGSRVLLTVTEGVAALVGLAVVGRQGGSRPGAGRSEDAAAG
jgi:glycosyltransferase 2 family protein